MPGLLDDIHGPDDVKALDPAHLPALAQEIRDFLVAAVARTGGHLGPNLGVVELTIALHRVFDSPHDVLLWDTGHQAYVHKLLTGRAADFDRLRQAGGLSGYPSRAESEHDHVENSHASTALSYADGYAKAFALRGETDRSVVAVVGDGALTGGMCWEAINNIAAAPERPVVIVVNDNGRSYAPTVGGLAQHLNALRLSPSYEQVLDLVKGSLARTPVVGAPLYDALHGMKKGIKDLLQPQAMFEDLGLKYVGPIDGHDVGALEQALRRARDFGEPVIVHCLTKKGHGYPPAEADEADNFHGVSIIDPITGRPVGIAPPSWTQVFAEEMVAIGHERDDVVAITAAMLRPVGLHGFETMFPDRVFDVGIAEQHAVASAAGLASAGMHPVVCVYATFLNRAFDQVLMDVALHGLPVTFVLDRAGVTGEDGPSHNGMWDLSLLGVVPGMRVAAPRDSTRLRELLREAVEYDEGPTALRFPKASVNDNDIDTVDRIGGMDVLRRDDDADVLIVSAGAVAPLALEVADRVAAQGVGVTVVDPRWVLPVDGALPALAAAHALVVTIEDNGRAGGIGDAVARELRDRSITTPVQNVALPQEFLPTGRRDVLLRELGLSAQEVARAAVEAVARA
ncbi:MAG: 1-deoxy-D-xylulose-5-phosphate synthase, partial [Frankiaceae bacterium]|nr:1-deoxy-D-xylulose-5-phosphate synthase [Frankiaceae bacterium]MBV9368616.1 1-deoxy-D-xylulose-5-phosphate synthase [Frankiales bacterium]